MSHKKEYDSIVFDDPIFYTGNSNCTPAAIEDFPGDLFTREQRQAGAVAFHITISLYLFLALAVVCDKYFVPAVERISQGEWLQQSIELSESMNE